MSQITNKEFEAAIAFREISISLLHTDLTNELTPDQAREQIQILEDDILHFRSLMTPETEV